MHSYKKKKVSTKLKKNKLGLDIDDLIIKNKTQQVKEIVNENPTNLRKTDLNSFATLSLHQNNLELFKFFIEEKNIDPKIRSGGFLELAVENELYDFIDYLLDMKDYNNEKFLRNGYMSIFKFSENNAHKLLNSFWKLKSLRESLKIIDPYNYQKYIITDKIKTF
jgi:hypothetical protein